MVFPIHTAVVWQSLQNTFLKETTQEHWAAISNIQKT